MLYYQSAMIDQKLETQLILVKSVFKLDWDIDSYRLFTFWKQIFSSTYKGDPDKV